MQELLNRSFFNMTVAFVSIVLVAFTLAVVASIIEHSSRDSLDPNTVPLSAQG